MNQLISSILLSAMMQNSVISNIIIAIVIIALIVFKRIQQSSLRFSWRRVKHVFTSYVLLQFSFETLLGELFPFFSPIVCRQWLQNLVLATDQQISSALHLIFTSPVLVYRRLRKTCSRCQGDFETGSEFSGGLQGVALFLSRLTRVGFDTVSVDISWSSYSVW